MWSSLTYGGARLPASFVLVAETHHAHWCGDGIVLDLYARFDPSKNRPGKPAGNALPLCRPEVESQVAPARPH
jgi:hypothetical protein